VSERGQKARLAISGSQAEPDVWCLVHLGFRKVRRPGRQPSQEPSSNSHAESARDKPRRTYSKSLRVSGFTIGATEFLDLVNLVNLCRFLWSITRSDDGKQNVNLRFRPTLRQFLASLYAIATAGPAGHVQSSNIVTLLIYFIWFPRTHTSLVVFLALAASPSHRQGSLGGLAHRLSSSRYLLTQSTPLEKNLALFYS